MISFDFSWLGEARLRSARPSFCMALWLFWGKFGIDLQYEVSDRVYTNCVDLCSELDVSRSASLILLKMKFFSLNFPRFRIPRFDRTRRRCDDELNRVTWEWKQKPSWWRLWCTSNVCFVNHRQISSHPPNTFFMVFFGRLREKYASKRLKKLRFSAARSRTSESWERGYTGVDWFELIGDRRRGRGPKRPNKVRWRLDWLVGCSFWTLCIARRCDATSSREGEWGKS